MTVLKMIEVGCSVGSVVFCGMDMLFSRKKEQEVRAFCELLSINMEDLKNDVKRADIPQKIVDEVVKEAVEDQVDAMVSATIRSITDSYRAEVRKKVNTEVKEAVDNMRPMIEDEIRRQIDDIDISTVKDRVIRDATKIATDKFTNELSTASAAFKGQINAMKDIYSSLADSLKK